jgi:NAD-dependent dihydropyrimidine dehydrogenase PreA subunit
MVKHIVDIEKCRGCGECVEACGLELWQLVEVGEGKKIARAIEEAAEICHLCGSCKDHCLEHAITLEDAE